MKNTITDKEAIDLVKSTFAKINQARSSKEVQDIIDEGDLVPYKMDEVQYPKIEFNITKSEISQLKGNGFIDDEDDLTGNISTGDPLARLLYAMIWKNGGLKKIKHIVKGVLNSGDVDAPEKEDGLVFYQFGKHLENKEEPIIDQHVLRAFALYQSDADLNARKKETVTRKEDDLIAAYKTWLANLKGNFNGDLSYAYHVDKVLFALGKAVKLKKSKFPIA